MSNTDILMLQEHCLFKSCIEKLKKLNAYADVIGTSPMDESVTLEGRPHGGCAILYKSNLHCKISPVSCKHIRLCGVTLTINEGTFLILNAYMPCDSGLRNADYDDYNDVLHEVCQIIHTVNPLYVLFGGDLNTDLRRRTPYVTALRQFCENNEMSACIEKCSNSIPYTYIGPRSTSVIDHIVLSNALVEKVISYDVIDCTLYSDHVPLKIILDFDLTMFEVQERVHKCRTAWHKATSAQCNDYQLKLQTLLEQIDVTKDVFSCKNFNCTKHIDDLCVMYQSVLNACLCAADECIPKTGVSSSSHKGRRVVPGWNQHVNDLKKESLMWHHNWKSCGRPHDGYVAEMRRLSRAKYHKACKDVLRKADVMQMEKMAHAISENKTRDLWKEVRKIKGRSNFAPGNIDGCTDNTEIADLFGKKYMDLYNSVPYDENDMNDIKNIVLNRIHNESKVTYCVTVQDVSNAIKQLKSGKSDGEEGLQSDHVIHAPHLFTVLLTAIINCMLVHGTSPETMITGVMVPIPKSKGQICKSDNYRAITLSSIIGKVVDLIILVKESHSLMSSDLQFGFKPGVSTTQCTFAMNETIRYYNYKRNSVYVALLDATKAFDKVNYCKMFKKLLHRNVSPIVLRLLINMYTKQKLKVKWSQFVSETFVVSNGVKQGGVLSPVLFSVYIDDLLLKLKRSGLGCRIGNSYAGCLSYADDLTLIAPTKKALQNMIYMCEEYARDFDVTFNGSKSVFMVFKGNACKEQSCYVTVNGITVSKSAQTMHLGHMVSSCDRNSMIKTAIGQFWKQFNVLISDFGHIDPFYTCKLFKQYCCSFYGAPLWSFQFQNDICIAWRKALRKLWRLHPQTHGDLLAIISDCIPLEISLYKRFSTFAVKIRTSKCKLIRSICSITKCNPLSTFNQNCLVIEKLYRSLDKCYTGAKRLWLGNLEEVVAANAKCIIELIAIRDGHLHCDIERGITNVILEDLCIS